MIILCYAMLYKFAKEYSMVTKYWTVHIKIIIKIFEYTVYTINYILISKRYIVQCFLTT